MTMALVFRHGPISIFFSPVIVSNPPIMFTKTTVLITMPFWFGILLIEVKKSYLWREVFEKN